MRTLYLSCAMGASGNMLLGALLDLLEDQEAGLAALDALGIPGVSYHRRRKDGPGGGNLITVTVHGHEEDEPHEHHHGSGLGEVLRMIRGLPAPAPVLERAERVYRSIAEAEAKVHGTTPSEVHFHEVGSLDAVADVAGVCLLLERLRPEQVVASPVHVGSGTVRCAHGVLPVPAPATAALLAGIPWYMGDVPAELCTPTGAALLREIASSFGAMPPMRAERIGYGYGTKEFDRPNCLQAVLGETEDKSGGELGDETVYEVRCNVDDMTGEELAFARERLEESGVLDMTVLPAMMKKNRPGFLLLCLCREAQLPNTVELLLRHTTTGGVRYAPWRRAVLETSFETAETPFGPVRKKRYRGHGVDKEKAEYGDAAAAAGRAGVPLREVLESLPK